MFDIFKKKPMDIREFGRFCYKNKYKEVLYGLTEYDFYNTDKVVVFSDLKMAAYVGKEETVRAFVENGEFLKDKDSERVLSSAAEGGYIRIVKMLDEAGIDPSADNNLALRSVLNESKDKEVIDYLLADIRVMEALVESGNLEYLPDDVKEMFVF